MQTRRRFAGIGAALAVIVTVTGCSMFEAREPLDEHNIQQRVADAQREAGTFRFEVRGPAPDGNGVAVTKGQIEYADNGKLKRLAFEIKGMPGEFVFADQKLYRSNAGQEFRRLGGDATSSATKAWDWADAIESGPKVQSVQSAGEDEIGSVSTTKYRLTFADHKETWWIDEDDRLIKQTFSDGGGKATLADYGEPVEIPDPAA